MVSISIQLYVANEGRFILFIPPQYKDQVIHIMHAHSLGTSATLIGEVTQTGRPQVSLMTSFGVERTLDLLSGELLPRIC